MVVQNTIDVISSCLNMLGEHNYADVAALVLRHNLLTNVCKQAL
jgi:hypothetical protein